ncbi:MAG TPA: ATP-binding protein [Pseudolabrys sp.]|nr:ATP-binding protein [Pseudolabrys sp.]
MAKQRRKRAKRPRTRRKRTTRSRAHIAHAHDATAIEAALAGVAHDIRTPLTGIVALAELLASSDLPPRERRWANAVKDGAEHLAALTTLIVDAARASTAGIVLQREPFSPRRLAETVATALTARAGSKGIKVDISIPADLPDVLAGDALRLHAALENLADNAVKFTEAGSVALSVKAERAGRDRIRLVFTFTDTGIGLSAEEIKRLFRPFAQASEQVARKYGGAGLGLSFVKRLAKLMGGDLTVTSSKGRGSTFRFNVQVDLVTAGPISIHEGGAKKLEAPLAILCAEDNPYGRVVMNTILTEMGHRVDFVESGEAAVQAVQRNRYDAVLMDVTLTGLDGIEATRRIRALPGEAGKVPIIGISGRGEATNEQAARNAGMDFYFVKPVSPARLAQALSSLSFPRVQREGGEPH